MGRIISPRFFVVQGSGYAHFVKVAPYDEVHKGTFRRGRCPHRPKIRIKLRPSRSETLSAKVLMGSSSGGAVSEAD